MAPQHSARRHDDEPVSVDLVRCTARSALVGVELFRGFGILFEGGVGLSGGGEFFADPFVAGARGDRAPRVDRGRGEA